ncbi:hypothetical protein FNZ56_10455 [Pseudoluteimonas lycopersici]|uniref:Uncharacterized protein n=1 Tax=Pseudoluteimonas lycopersici TaxID=1324796 RepID=A0A516V6Y3_9GAMM|nr:hypothetical protein [Lysobacter lycopersici]QDQ74272.1 hypothetical protein FNZ56_10455 [Lysobacter lycopersici]
MKAQKLKAAAVALLSAGWVAPLYYAADAYASYWTQELLPVLRHEPLLSSFPHLLFATQLTKFALVWCGLVVLAWSYAGYRRLAT